MPSYVFDIGERESAGLRFMSQVQEEVQRAIFTEKEARHLTQQAIADKLGVNRSVVNRRVMGLENMTARSIGELLWAVGWEPVFVARKLESDVGENDFFMREIKTTSSTSAEVVKLEEYRARAAA